MGMIITFKDVINKGKCLLKGRVKKEMTLEQALEVYACVINDLEKNTDLSSVHLKKLGITETCKIKAKNLLSEILNNLIASDIALNEALLAMQNGINTFIQGVGGLKDEKVKTAEADPAAGYLADKIISLQKGCVTVADNKIVLMGFAPIGSVMYIDAGRIGDFDAQGKGKADTDVWGWALSNGQSGTRNRFNKFPRYISANSDAGKIGGANEAIITADMLPSHDLAITGGISASQQGDVKVTIKLEANKISDGNGGSVYLLRVGSGSSGQNTITSIPIDLSHSHNHSLVAKFQNTAPKKISFIPEYIHEIPIQRINV